MADHKHDLAELAAYEDFGTRDPEVWKVREREAEKRAHILDDLFGPAPDAPDDSPKE